MPEKKQGKRGKRLPSASAERLRRILATNVQWLIEQKYPLNRFGKKSHAEKALSIDAKLSHSSIQRALNPETGVTLDVLADLAAAFERPVVELLDPNMPFLRAQLRNDDAEGARDSKALQRRTG